MADDAILSLKERWVIHQALVEQELTVEAAPIPAVRTIHQAQVPWIDHGEGAGRLRHRSGSECFAVCEVADAGKAVEIVQAERGETGMIVAISQAGAHRNGIQLISETRSGRWRTRQASTKPGRLSGE